MDTSKGRGNKQLGKWGEQQAETFLKTKGYQILDRNFRTPYGEIDLITRKGDIMVFVEVKTRSSGVYGNPEEAVTLSKLTHMIESAESYLQEHPDIDNDWRIDVIAIRKITGQQPEINHFENVGA